ncbi:MAG: RagB/SusD family nutrient uptake outer membrane protein [Psychroflexus sp.]|nr:RagB/SusD family nutrient uptake outer membrane protein [Psychroflexus sp.]
MKNLKTHIIKGALSLFFLLFICSCEDYLDIDLPDNKIVSEAVFEDEQGAKAALQGIYNQLTTAKFSDGGSNSITLLSGLSADNIMTIINTEALEQFEYNEISIMSSNNHNIWTSAYNIIYQTNSLLSGLKNSHHLNNKEKEVLVSKAKFIRAFVNFYLVNLYGDIPLVLSTDYRVNSVIPRSDKSDIYQQIESDLASAHDVLINTDNVDNDLEINAYTVKALYARYQLYQGNWEAAEEWSSDVIQSGHYQLEQDLDNVFLSSSAEAIWQLSPEGSGSGASHTNEGNLFIIDDTPSVLTPVALTSELINIFTVNDERKTNWINDYTENQSTYYYPFKYKIKYDTSDHIQEYSMVMRLAEQYLIRAEARAQQNKLQGAIADVDMIKQRAGLPLLSVTQPGISQQSLLEEILLERRKELFAEWGHRWFDLKRLEKATEILAPKKASWDPTDILYPISEDEINKNHYLNQNPGY